MNRLFITVFLMFGIAIFWHEYSSKYVGFLYNPATQSKEFLHNNRSDLNFLASDSTKMNEAFKLFSSRGVKIILGPPTSAEGENALSFLKSLNMVAVSATISSSKLLSTNYIFSFTPSNSLIISRIRELLEDLETKNLLLISDPKNRQYSDEFMELLKTFKGTNVYYYNENSLKSLNLKDYDSVVMTIFSRDAVDCVKILKSSNPTIRIIGTESVMSADYLSYGGNSVEGTYLVYPMPYLENPEVELISEVADFLSKHRFLSADQFRRFLKHCVVETKTGRHTFSNNSMNRKIRLFQVVNGKFVEKD
ncbi:MAG: ABC transporter substrate-binding protein [Fervidobacterium sp.]|nr:ABC transporter substrate-binding protein [Fervidobacterium sp.]